ncbi:ABC transporter ATP-binding protein [Candidatus Nomurabacteria bacterium]|nr:ABC transporter ATP-binding protein [Candidatus Nomurabacteria bacterium]
MLEIKNLNAGYGEIKVIKDVSLTLQNGSVSVLMGPNGAGKSTLLKSVFNITDIDSGKVFFEEEDITRLPAHALLEKGIAFVSQGRVNFSTLSVEDNLRLGAHHVQDKAEVDSRLEQVYKQFPILKDRRKEYAFSLSGGQQQMLAIGRALMSKPRLLLMDEPSLGLAPKLVKEVFKKIIEIRDNFDATILIVEHNLKSLMDVADHGYILVQGELVAQDTCSKLKNSPIMKKVFVGAFD